MTADGRSKCGGCGGRTSVMAGTMFDRYRTPVGVWFMPCRMFASHKDWISAPGIMMRLLSVADTPEYQELRRRIADITEF
jgi:hypothetical protein